MGCPGGAPQRSPHARPISPAGVRTEQDLYVRLIDSVTKQVSLAVHSPPPPLGLRVLHSPPSPPSLSVFEISWVTVHSPSASTDILSSLEKDFFPSLSLIVQFLSGWEGSGDGSRKTEG